MSEPDVLLRFTVKELTRKGIDARATCLTCDELMLRQWEARPGILWFKCAGITGMSE